MKENFTEFLLRNIGIFIYFVFTNVGIWLYYRNIDFEYHLFGSIKTPIVSIILITLIIFFIFYKLIIFFKLLNNIYMIRLLKIIIWGGVILNLFIIQTNLFMLSNFQTIINYAAIDAFLHTNKHETFEFIKGYLSLKNLLLFLFLLLSLFILKLSIKVKINNILNIFYLLFLFRLFGNDITRSIINNDFKRYTNIPVVNFFRIVFYSDVFSNYELLSNSYKSVYMKYKNIESNVNIENIILIIGESSRRDAYEDYGQLLKTTPFLKNNINKIIYSDVISPDINTNLVMKTLLNFANNDNIGDRKYYENLDLIHLFKLSGYKTFWISNQDYMPGWINNATIIGKFADYSYFYNKMFSSTFKLMETKNLDGELIPVIKKLEHKKNNFIVVHLLGNHFIYNQRYPREFNKFTIDDIERSISSLDSKKIVSEYYNSISYTDFIINEIYELYKNKDTIIIYLSDHGEFLSDEPKHTNIFLHGTIDKEIAEIPFVFLYSDIFKEKHQDLLNRLEMAKDLPFMSDDLAHLLCDIAGIEIDVYEPSRSPRNEKYNKFRIRMFANEVDYDKVLKND